MELLLVVVGGLLALWLVMAAAVRMLITVMDSIDGPDETSLTITDVRELTNAARSSNAAPVADS